MYGAFQSNAFQSNAFQIVRAAETAPETGNPTTKYSFHYSSKYDEEDLRAKIAAEHAVLRRLNQELLEAERRKDEKLALEREKKIAKRSAKNAAKMAAALELELQHEITRLQFERLALIRRIDEEEAILVLLLSLSFIN